MRATHLAGLLVRRSRSSVFDVPYLDVHDVDAERRDTRSACRVGHSLTFSPPPQNKIDAIHAATRRGMTKERRKKVASGRLRRHRRECGTATTVTELKPPILRHRSASLRAPDLTFRNKRSVVSKKSVPEPVPPLCTSVGEPARKPSVRYLRRFQKGDMSEHAPGKLSTEYDNHMF